MSDEAEWVSRSDGGFEGQGPSWKGSVEGWGREGGADHWEEPAVDAADALFTDDGDGAVHEPAISRVGTFRVVDEFCSVHAFSV